MKFILPFLVIFLATARLSAQDVTEFWKKTCEHLASEPMEAKVETLNEPLPYKKYRVTLRGLDGVRFISLLSLPIQGEAPARPWPVIITVPGYGGTQQGVMLGECQRGYAIMQVFPRGQGASEALWKLDGDKLTSQLDHPEGAYYQGAYADVIRAIDFAVRRDDLDRQRVALVGTSQGGGIALAVAALDPRVKAVVAHVPFLCNFRLAAGIKNSRIKNQLDQAKRNDERALRTLDYFDPYQLAPRLRVPVLMSAGGKDEVCPLPAIRSVHDRLPRLSTLKIYPELVHTSCVDFYNFSWLWLDQHFRSPAK
jgi:cephalosporin-C deacetylase